ncbi:hypothetical protein ACOME3_007506 [Neoechinorhynchus agilis]
MMRRSHLKRELRVLRIRRRNGTEKKPYVWIDAGIHGREWISPASIVCFVHFMLFSNDSSANILENYDFYVMPFVNPDGYEISFNNRFNRLRYWRKNARPHDGNVSMSNSRTPKCRGVDLNRNYPFAWNFSPGEGASQQPCSEVYQGPFAASEPEIAALIKFVFKRRKRFLVFLSFHSYGQYWFVPWGYTRDIVLQDHDELVKIAQVAADAMKTDIYKDWKVGQSSHLMYVSSGTSEDWAKGVAGIKYSYCIELPPDDDATRGFVLPDDQILPVAISIYKGIEALLREIDKNERKSVL